MDDADTDTGIAIPLPSPRSKQPSETPIHQLARPDLNWYHLISVAFQGTLQEHASPSILHAKPAAIHARWNQLCPEKDFSDVPRASAGDVGRVPANVDEARDVDGDVDMGADGADASPVTTSNTTGDTTRRPRGRPRKHTSPAIAAAKRTLQHLSDISDRQWGGPAADEAVGRPTTRSRSTRRRGPSESPSRNGRMRGRSQRRKEAEAVSAEDRNREEVPAAPPLEEKRRTRGRSSRRQAAAPLSDQTPITKDANDAQPSPPPQPETETVERRITRSRSRRRRESAAAPPAESPLPAVGAPEAPPEAPPPPVDTAVPSLPVTRRKPTASHRQLPLHLTKILFFFTTLPKPRGKPAVRPLSFAVSYSFFRSSVSLAQQQRRTLSSDKLVMLCMRARVRMSNRIRAGRTGPNPILPAGPFLHRNLRIMHKRLEERRRRKARQIALETAMQQSSERSTTEENATAEAVKSSDGDVAADGSGADASAGAGAESTLLRKRKFVP
ncbi:hypothetical protein TWF696_006102 [Orbilia brochopaga]|uniref:Uncharacterized protein n=1 Tax=Orbilia brochopaga TaxID=3140254 RepID=A0AAV9UZ53_9PEZI